METAGNGRHAFEQLQRQRVDVILSDLCMPDLDGRAFYAMLQQQDPALYRRLIFLTGASEEADARTFLAQCGRPWLPKPYSLAALRQTMQQVLASAAPALSLNGCKMRSQQLWQRCRALRRKSQALADIVQALYIQSAHVQQWAPLAGQQPAGHGPGRGLLPAVCTLLRAVWSEPLLAFGRTPSRRVRTEGCHHACTDRER